MKKIILLVLVFISLTVIAQEPAAPCCNVVGINHSTNTIIARNLTTGRLFSFKADAMDIRSIKLNDPVSSTSDFKTVSSVNGAARTYKADVVNASSVYNDQPVSKGKVTGAEPVNGIAGINWAAPCCSIVQIDNIEPCCNVVTAKNKSTGATIKFKAPELVLSSVKTGDPVYLEPCCNLAILQSSYQSNDDQLNSFGYPIETGEDIKDENASSKWVITPANMKGVLGKLHTDFPSGVEWRIEIRNATDNKFITSRSGASKHGPTYDISPGIYNFQLNTILVENVPIEKGKETRLRTGILQIVSEGHWNIYNETKDKFKTSGNKPGKFALPIGTYQLKLGDQFYPVVIRDNETVEY